MCVLWVDLVSELGGAQYSMLEVCRSLAALGIKVVAAVPHGAFFDKLKNAGIVVYPIMPLRASRHGIGLFLTASKLLSVPGTIRQIVSVVKPDIIHANNLTAFVAARKHSIKTPVVWHVRDVRLPATLARLMAPKATRIIVASQTIDEYLARILQQRDLGRVRIIRNGIDLTRFSGADKRAARRQFNLPEQAPIIGMVAHLVPWKRHDAFIEAAALIHAKAPQTHFVLVGRDLFNEHARWIESLRTRVAELGFKDAFHWVDDCEDAARILPAFDLLLHPAIGEPFGRVICEAMVLSIPVIAAESGGPAYILENGISGLLVRDGNARLMAEAALDLLASSERAAALARVGLEHVRERFNIARVAGQLANEYKKIVDDAEISKRKGD